MPLLLIQGTEDRVTPLDAHAARLAQAVPQARLVVLDGCGHLPEVEMPEQVDKLIREFLHGSPAYRPRALAGISAKPSSGSIRSRRRP
jgi:pimeloyl-ACP methyl ester carboxylesterase